MRERIDNATARVARTWPDDVKHFQVLLCDQAIKMGVYEGETWARSPVSKETRLDVVRCNGTFEEDIVLQEDHG